MKSAARFLFKLLLFIFFLGTVSPLNAQTFEEEDRYNFWGGYSFNSIKFLGKTQNSQTQIFALGYQNKIREYSNNRNLWYTADIIPYVHFQYPKRDESDRIVTRSGFGISPVGFALTQHSSSRLTPFIQTSGGIIYMESNFPTDKSRRLNFTFDITLGGNLKINSYSMVSFGYKFHHISNAETGKENPGLDSNFLFLTLSIH